MKVMFIFSATKMFLTGFNLGFYVVSYIGGFGN